MSQFKPVTGSFLDGIACDIPSNNWGPQDWRKQFDNMKAIGMDTVIIIRVGWGDSAMYDSPTLQTPLFPEEDLVELFFAEADRVGFRLYLGMHDSHEHWLKNDWESEIEINVRLIDEMLERYGTHRSFHGWYMSHEGGIEYHMPKIWKPLATKLRAHDESKRILVSPRYAGEKWQPEKPLSPQQHAQHFDYIFTEMEGLIDEAAFMDGHTAFSSLEGFVAATADVCAKHGVEFWSNLETFDRDMRWRFPPIEWSKMRFKLELVQPYVEKIVTFEAPHFLSPFSMYPSAPNLYERYRDYLEAKQSRAS